MPAASYARTVITFVPTKSGALKDQDVVPLAWPVSPKPSDHFTAVTPTLSLALPEMAMLAAEVEPIVNPGERICRLGGVVSLPVGAGAGGAGAGAGVGVGVGVGAGAGIGVGLGVGVVVVLLPYRARMAEISSLVRPVEM